ncbi:MAG: type II toxin-antitoxin system HicB family antitoxin [Verrucomicrobiae bacterium]
MQIKIELEQEADGHWIAEVPVLSGCLSYGVTKADAVRSAEALALRILAERCESGDDSFAREAFAVSV